MEVLIFQLLTDPLFWIIIPLQIIVAIWIFNDISNYASIFGEKKKTFSFKSEEDLQYESFIGKEKKSFSIVTPYEYDSIFKSTNKIEFKDNRISIGTQWHKGVKEISETINDYLSKNGDAVIDYHLMKDIVERYCNRLENNITTILPFPLYIGLIGTMIGIILGLGDLSGSLSLSETQIKVNDFTPLLNSVKSAMVASASGVLITTALTGLYKWYKEKLEEDKDKFLSCIQVELLPNVGSDFTSAMTKMAGTLSSFNETFEKNVGNLDYALSTVNGSYENQVTLLEKIDQMKITKIASANIDVYDKLQHCTDEIGELATQLEQLSTASSENVKSAEALSGLMDQWQDNTNRLAALFDNQLNSIQSDLCESMEKLTGELSRCFFEQVKTVEERTKEMPKLVNELDKLADTKKAMEALLSATKEQNTKIDKMLNALATGKPVETINTSSDWSEKYGKWIIGSAVLIPTLLIVQLILDYLK